MTRLRRAVAVLAVAMVGLLAFAAPASAAATTGLNVPEYASSDPLSWYAIQGKWNTTAYGVQQDMTSAYVSSSWALSEVYRVPGTNTVTLSVSVLPGAAVTGKNFDWWSSFELWCSAASPATLAGSVVETTQNFSVSGFSGAGVQRNTVTFSAGCPTARPNLYAIKANLETMRLPTTGRVLSPFMWYADGAAYAYRAFGSGFCDARVGGGALVPVVIDGPHGGSGLYGPCAVVGSGAGGGGGGEGAPATSSAFGNAADFNVVCANPPAAEWLSFSWLPGWVGFYAKCLFVPAAGFDGQRVRTAWDATAAGQIVNAMGAMRTGISVSSSCGTLGGGNFPGTSTPFAISTCDPIWSSIGATSKPIVGAMFILLTVMSCWNMSLHAIGLHYFGFEDKDEK